MRRNIVYTSVAIVLIALSLTVLSILYLLPKLTSVDAQNQSAVLTALDGTPMTRATGVSFFTGGALEQTVEGVDTAGQPLFVIVQPGREITTVYAKDIETEQAAVGTVMTHIADAASVVSHVLGITAPSSGAGAPGAGLLVWEVIARRRPSGFVYAYVDAHSGTILWHFTSSDTFRLWDQ